MCSHALMNQKYISIQKFVSYIKNFKTTYLVFVPTGINYIKTNVLFCHVHALKIVSL